MKKHHLLYLLVLLNIKVYTQNNVKDSVVFAIKELKLNKALRYVQKIDDPINTMFFKELNYLIKGNEYDTISNSFNNIRNKIIVNIYNGDAVLRYSPPNDSLSFEYYKKALKAAKENNLVLYKNICYQKICNVLQKNNFSKRDLQSYLNEFKTHATDSIDKFWVNYYNYDESHFVKNKAKEIDFSFAYTYPFLEATILQLKGVNASENKNLNDGIAFYSKAIKLFKPYNYYITNKNIQRLKFNIGIIEFHKKNYTKAIQTFKNIKITDNKKNDLFKYHWISKSYDSLKQKDSANLYYLKFYKVKDDIDKKGHAIAIIEDNAQERDSKNSTIISQLTSKMNTILPLLAIITFLLGLVYWYYKKYVKKTGVLEEEKIETLIKLDELKEVVIKNHIVLKDKTKVYVADLLYIKSDDHYLKVFLSNGNNHFVRGKLSEIIKELPPNFIRSHRSYIVNRNFVKQINNTFIILTDKTEIPLSRSYKDKL